MIRLIRGAAGSGKTRTVLGEFREAIAADRNGARLVVPTATLVRHLRNELARDGLVFPPGAVVSLSRFAAERAPEARLAPQGLLQAIAADVLRHSPPSEFSAVAATRGMPGTVLDAIHELESAGASPDSLRGGPLARIWRSISGAVEARGFVTRAGLLRRAAQNAAPLRIWMDGFLAFSPVEAELLASLTARCELTITLSNSDAARDADRLIRQIGARDTLLSGSSRSPERVIVQASSIERETDEIARRILTLHAEGFAFREMAVAVRDPHAYLNLLRAAFERFRIPARFYFEKPLEPHPAARFLTGLIECAMNSWDFEQTLDVLRANPAWGHSYDFDRFDFRLRDRLPGRGAEEFAAHCESATLRDEIRTWLSIERWVAMPAPASEWLSRMERIAESFYRPIQFASIESARSHASAVGAWLSAVKDAAAFWPADTGPVTLEQFHTILRHALAGATYATPDDRRDVVHVLQSYEARQWDIRALIVCGATERAYPMRRNANPLLADIPAKIPLRRPEDDAAGEVALMQALETRATGHLIFTWPLQDAVGRMLKPSRLIPHDIPTDRAIAVRPTQPAEPIAGRAGRIEAPVLLSALPERHRKLSITSLQDLMQCRFKFFADRTLELTTRPLRPTERLEARIGGLILHEALEHWQQDMNLNFRTLFETAFEEAIRQHRLPYGYRLEVERLNLGRIADQVQATQRWNPERTRVEVPLSIGFPGGIVANARVDRIDELGEDRAIVVDYKAGKVANVKKMVNSDASLQGPLYARAVRDELGLKVEAMIFWAIREDVMFGWGEAGGVKADVLREMPANWADDAYVRASERLAGFLSGQVHPHPTDEALCRWCDYAGACRIEVKTGELVRIAGIDGN